MVVRLGDIELKNPVIPASGTCGFGQEMSEWFDLNLLGAISTKGTTRETRYGNPLPRIAECPAGLLNAVGLQNPGVEEVIRHEMPALRAKFNGPIIANVSGFSIEEYAYVCERMDQESDAAILEVNISCPNVHNGGMAFGTSPGGCGGRDQSSEGGDDEAGVYEVEPERNGHSGYRSCMRRSRSGRFMSDKHGVRYAYRPSSPESGAGQPIWRLFGSGYLPYRAADGEPSEQGLSGYTDYRMRRREQRRGRDRDDDGWC